MLNGREENFVNGFNPQSYTPLNTNWGVSDALYYGYLPETAEDYAFMPGNYEQTSYETYPNAEPEYYDSYGDWPTEYYNTCYQAPPYTETPRQPAHPLPTQQPLSPLSLEGLNTYCKENMEQVLYQAQLMAEQIMFNRVTYPRPSYSQTTQKSNDVSKPKRNRRKRLTLRPETKYSLNSFFSENPYPNMERKTEIAEHLGMTQKNVCFYFQNTRAKLKKIESNF